MRTPRFTLKSAALGANALLVAGCVANARVDVAGVPSAQEPQRSAPAPAKPVDALPRSDLLASGSRTSSYGGDDEFILVRPGDTLGSLAHQHGVSAQALYSANALTSDQLIVGQHLILPRR